MIRIVLAFLLVLWACAAASSQDVTIDPALGKEQLKAVQTDLLTIGFAIGKPDGSFGPKSKTALVSFVEQFGPRETIVLDAELAGHVSRVAHAYADSPFKTAPADFGFLDAGATFSWDMRTLADPPCEPGKCVPTNELLATGDLTGDGLPELVYASDLQSTKFEPLKTPAPLLIFTRTAEDAYELLPVTTTQEGGVARLDSRFALIRDFNGDGLGDLFVATTGYDRAPFPGEQNVLLLSSPEGLVDRSMTHLPVQNDFAHGVDAGDLDGDGDFDMIVVTNYGAAEIEPYVLWNDGAGMFTPARLDTIVDRDLALFIARGLEHRSKYVNVAIVDIDKDGNLDLILCGSGDDAGKASGYPGMRQTRLIYGDGSGKWTAANAMELPTNRWGYATHTTDMDIADIDGDGDNDLVATLATEVSKGQWGGQFIQVLSNQNGTFVDVTDTAVFAQGLDHPEVAFPVELTIADLNADGAPDFVIRNRDPWVFSADRAERQAVMIGLNDGKGHFGRVDPRQWGAGTSSGAYLGADDFDGDGDIDLVGFEEIGELEPDWIVYGLKGTIYENQGKSVHEALPFESLPVAKIAVHIDGHNVNVEDNGLVFADFYGDVGNLDLGFDELSFLIGGRYAPMLHNFLELELALVNPIKASAAVAVEACYRAKVEKWDDGGTRVTLNLARSGSAFLINGGQCVIDALDGASAAEAEFVLNHFKDIAIGMVVDGIDRQIEHDGVREFFQRVAKGEITLTVQ